MDNGSDSDNEIDDVDDDDDDDDYDYDYDEENVDNDKHNSSCESSFYEEPTGNAQLSRRKVKLSQKIEKNRNALDNTAHNVRIRSKWKQSNANKYRYQVAFSTLQLPIHEEDDEEPIPSTSTVDVHNSLSTQNFETKKDSVIVDNGHQKHVIVHIDDSSDDDNDYDIHFDRKKHEQMCENESLLVAYDTV